MRRRRSSRCPDPRHTRPCPSSTSSHRRATSTRRRAPAPQPKKNPVPRAALLLVIAAATLVGHSRSEKALAEVQAFGLSMSLGWCLVVRRRPRPHSSSASHQAAASIARAATVIGEPQRRWSNHRGAAKASAVVARASPSDRSTDVHMMSAAANTPDQLVETSTNSARSDPAAATSSAALKGMEDDDSGVVWRDASTLSLDHLQDRVHMFVARHQQQIRPSPAPAGPSMPPTPPPPPPPRLAVAVAGGGGQFLSTLSSTPGASAVLLQGTLLYDRESFHAYLEQFPSSCRPGATASSSLSFGASEHGTDANGSNHSFISTASSGLQSSSGGFTNTTKFQYASLSAARQLSSAALQQACRLSAAGLATAALRWNSSIQEELSPVKDLRRRNLLHRHLTSAVGVGCSSALQTTTTATPTNQRRNSQAHVVVQRPDGRTVHELSMSIRRVPVDTQEYGDTGNTGDDRHGRRVRFLEDVAVAHGILSCIERSADSNMEASPHQSEELEGNDVLVEFRAVPESPSATENVDVRKDLSTVVHDAVDRVLSHQCSVVALVPEYHAMNSSDEEGSAASSISFTLLTHFALPPTSMVFPGSFNPVHEGHVQLARAAMDAVPQLRNVVWFELSLTNADKPALTAEEVLRRVQYFADSFAGEMAPLVDFQWGILLSNAPLFRQKVELLHPLLVPASKTRAARCGDDDLDGLDVIIGTDTLVRLIDPKYYQDSPMNMVKAIETMSARFVVGGRAVPGNGTNATNTQGSFAVGDDDVARLPEELQSRFVLIPEETFRVDVSSTEIRRKMKDRAESALSTGSIGSETR